MTERIKQCDVVESCVDCPRYGDDCDGDKRIEHTDLISRADAIERIANDNVVGGMKRINEYRDSTEHNDYLDGISTAIATVEDIPSADAVQRAVPTVVRVTMSDGSQYYLEHERDAIQADAVQGEWDSNQACSICGCQPWYERDIHTLHYCPNCGARMKGGAE